MRRREGSPGPDARDRRIRMELQRRHLAEERPLVLRSLTEPEEKLDPRVFFRANRSQFINLNAVRSIHDWFGERLMAKLDGGHEVVLSRRRARNFRERMSV